MGNKRILFFSSSSCKACKSFRPIVEKIAKEFGYVFNYIDVNKEPAVAMTYEVMSGLPITVVENDEQIYRKVGASSEERFRKEIQDNIG